MTANRLTASPAGEVYEVFAKKNPDDTLHHIGTVVAPDAELARIYAFTIYQEWPWVEMIVASRHLIDALRGVTEYLIFAQKSYQEPLELLGPLHIEGEAELIEEARKKFSGDDWIEVIAIPQPAVVQVIPNTEPLRNSP